MKNLKAHPVITSKTPQRFDNEDYENYRRLMLKTNALYRDNNPKSLYLKSSKGRKWNYLLRPIWYGNSMRKRGLWLFRMILTRC